MKDYIVKTTRSLRDEWNSRNTLYSLHKGSQVVYLFDCMKTREPWTMNCNNLRSGSIFVSLWKLHSGGHGETKREPSSRERHKGIVGRGHDLRLGKNLLWANAWKTMVTVDWRPPKRRFEPDEKNLWGCVLVVTTVSKLLMATHLLLLLILSLPSQGN